MTAEIEPSMSTVLPHDAGSGPTAGARRSKPKRKRPYSATLSITPDMSADTWLGAAGCAFGSQTCRGTTPALVPNPAKASMNSVVRVEPSRPRAAVRSAAKSNACA